MTTPDPISGAIIKGGIEQGVSAAKGLLERLCGPAVEELGLILQDSVRVYRLKRELEKHLGKVQAMMQKAGTEVRPVPMRTLLPLLEGAALEDDENLSDKWAGLLASAASAVEVPLTHPSFAHILSEITPREALILDRLYQALPPIDWNSLRGGLAIELGTSIESIDQAYGNLFRLGLCRIVRSDAGSVIELSPFGRFFLAAAYGPTPRGT
jgi:hypothetical protein